MLDKMDFIDDFIQEYKNNLCLWKADSAHFKNRTKRQEAYLRLIEVAANHGEQYNIERTKQKINNLRCAFRHQLKKYIESKNKIQNDEPYCPKRRYFESLMFLKDEENLDRRTKLETKSNIFELENIKDAMQDTEIGCQEPSNSKDQLTDVYSPGTKSNELPNQPTIISSVCVTGYVKDQDQRIVDVTSDGVGLTISKDHTMLHLNDSDKESQEKRTPQTKRRSRKRSQSTSSQMSNETEPLTTKSPKVDYSAVDLEKVISLACKTLHNDRNRDRDDNFSNFGKIIANKLRSMDPMQALYAEKLIGDVLFQGQMKLLTSLSINKLSIVYPSKET